MLCIFVNINILKYDKRTHNTPLTSKIENVIVYCTKRLFIWGQVATVSSCSVIAGTA